MGTLLLKKRCVTPAKQTRSSSPPPRITYKKSGANGRRLPLIQFDRDLCVTRRFMFLFICGILHRLWRTIFDPDRLQSREGEN